MKVGRIAFGNQAVEQVQQESLDRSRMAKHVFQPVTMTPKDTDSLERRMLMKIHAITAQHLPNYSPLTPDEIRAIHSAAFAGLDGEDPDYGL